MGHCTGCGSEIIGDQAFCPSCGRAIASSPSASLGSIDITSPLGNTASDSSPVPSSATAVPQQSSWTAIQSHGMLVLGESSQEYAVYDGAAVFGRWPKSAQGLAFAKESFGAHSQSLAHGMAYAATGYQDPTRLGLPTTPIIKSQTYASPMSYVRRWQ